jgi:hypothetical protein
VVIELVKQISPLRSSVEKGGDPIRHGTRFKGRLRKAATPRYDLEIRLGLGTH